MIKLIITEIQACDTQKELYRFVYPVSDVTRKGDKKVGRRNVFGNVSLRSGATGLTGRPQPWRWWLRWWWWWWWWSSSSSSSSSSSPPHLREGITVVRYTIVMILLYILIKYRGKFQWRSRWKKTFLSCNLLLCVYGFTFSWWPYRKYYSHHKRGRKVRLLEVNEWMA